MSVIDRRVFVALCAVRLLATSARGAGIDDLPRYRLRVGQELTYALKRESVLGQGAKAEPYGEDGEWQIRVLRQNADGSWHLLLRENRSLWYGRGKDRKVQEVVVTLDYCDLFPDGRHIAPALFGYSCDKGLDPSRVFPRLPGDHAAAAGGWEGTYAMDDARTRYTIDHSVAGRGKYLYFGGVRETPTDKLYLVDSKASYTFDNDRQLVLKATETTTRGSEKRQAELAITLVGEKMLDAATTARLAAEADRFFAAEKVYDDLTTQAESSTDAKDLCARAAKVLEEVRGQLSLPLFRERIDAALKWHDTLERVFVKAAAARAAILGQPSPDWETKDYEGHTRALKDFRGKVVVLDFWGRGCGWCMRAMPQVARLADDFKGQPVAVLGMSLDIQEEDARLVIEKMGIKYPVLHARELRDKYRLIGVPVMLILDGKGMVREAHCGYQPSLHAAASASVRKLLAEMNTPTRP